MNKNSILKKFALITIIISIISIFFIKYVNLQTYAQEPNTFKLEGIFQSPKNPFIKSSCGNEVQIETLTNNIIKPEKILFDYEKKNAYILHPTEHIIQQFAVSTTSLTFVKTIGAKGTAAGQFKDPRDFAIDTHNNLYVADYGNHRIQKFSSLSNTWEVWCKKNKKGKCVMGTGNGEFKYPTGIAADNFSVYVTDVSKRVQILNTSGLYITSFPTTLTPTKIAINPDYTLTGSQIIYMVTGRYIRKYIYTNPQGLWMENTQQGWPIQTTQAISTNLIIDSDENIYSFEASGHAIKKYDKNGILVAKHIKNGKKCGELRQPHGGALYSATSTTTAEDILYVADTNNNRIQKFVEVQALSK